MARMTINLDTVLTTVYGTPIRRQGPKFLAAEAKYGSLYGQGWFQYLSPELKRELEADVDEPMTVGYLLVEATPKGVDAKASQHEHLAIGKLQRRIAKFGTQNFTADEIATLKKAVVVYLAERGMPGVADQICELLDPPAPAA